MSTWPCSRWRRSGIGGRGARQSQSTRTAAKGTRHPMTRGMRKAHVTRNGDEYEYDETGERWTEPPMFVIVAPEGFEDWQYLEPPEYHDV